MSAPVHELDEADPGAAQGSSTDAPRRLSTRPGPADRNFTVVLTAAGLLVLAIMVLVGTFLTLRGANALQVAGLSFLTEPQWNPDGGEFGIAAVLTGTVLIGIVAISIAFPLALGTSLYISEMAPPGSKRLLVNLVDLMAAIPSVVYGLWGFYLLQPHLLVVGASGDGLPRWLATYFGWVPFFSVTSMGERVDMRDPLLSGTSFTSSTFIAGIVVAMMVAPIATSIMRENFSQAPVGEREGAFALGATRWGMIRSVVLPFGRGGMIGGTMLGLGRALGETIAVLMIISPVFEVKFRILELGSNSVSSLIALRVGEAGPFATSALMAAGLVLFGMTLVINFAASAFIARSRSGSVSDA